MSSILTPGFVYFNGLTYTLVGAMGSTGPAGGDLSGSYPNPTVVGLQGLPLSSVTPTSGQILEWNGTTWISSDGSFARIAGDLGGTPSSPTVIGLQDRPVSSNAPIDGQVLGWNGTAWTPTAAAGGFTAGGDLSGSASNQEVIAINRASVPLAGSLTDGYFLQVSGPSTLTYGPVNSLQGNPVTAQTLGAGQNNYALVWNGSTWGAENVFLNQSAGGNLGDYYPNPTTRALWNAAIPEVLPSNPTATPGFVIGNVLQVTNVTANTQALGYGTLNLGIGSSATNVSGILPNAYQAPQFVSGDLSGYTNGSGSSYNSNAYGATVTKIQNIPIESTSLGLSQDGYVLTYSHSDGQWEPKSSTTGSSLAGDITGAITNTHLAEIQGINVAASGSNTPTSGQVLLYGFNSVTSSNEWFPQGLSLTLNNDVTGSSSVSGTMGTTVVAIQHNAIESQSLGSSQDGYILTWINSNHQWEAIPNAGGSGAFVAGGDLSGSSVDQTVIRINGTTVPVSPSTNTVLIATSSTSSTWNTISDANVNSGANIAGSKINTTTGGIVSIVASNTIQAAVLTATTEIFLNSNSGPTITAGAGAPSSTPADGSIYLRTDGDGSGTQSIYSYEGVAWVPVGAAAAGAAGGDLSGFYPNPTVIAIQKNAVDNTLLGASEDGYVLTWKNMLNEWKAEPFSASFTAGGDLSGTSTSQTVIAIHGNPVSATASTAGQLLIENSGATGSAWTSLSGDVTASVSTVGKITVVALQGNSVEAQSLTSVDDGYVLTWVNASTEWQALPTGSGSVTLNGDVTGAAGSNTVVKINGTSVPASPSANQVLVATSGTAATWELLTNSQISASAAIAVNKLAAGTAAQILLNSSTPTPTWTSVTGDISLSNTGVTSVTKIQGNTVTSGALTKGDFFVATSTSNWAEVALTGDIAASAVTPGLTTVIALQTNPIEFQTLTSDDDGYVLTWHNAGPYWYAAPAASGSFSAGGDLSGTSSDQTVESIQGVVISGTPSIGWIIQATSPTAASWQAPPSGSFSAGGDLSGSSTDQTVIALQGNPVESGTLGAGQDGYVLTWVNADTQWRAEPVAGGGGGESGKVIYTSKTITADYAIDFSEYDYYIWCNQTSPINVTLPVPSPGRTINIKDISNNASSNNISILQNASEDIEGSASTFILSTNLGSVTLAADNNSNWWLV